MSKTMAVKGGGRGQNVNQHKTMMFQIKIKLFSGGI